MILNTESHFLYLVYSEARYKYVSRGYKYVCGSVYHRLCGKGFISHNMECNWRQYHHGKIDFIHKVTD